MSAVEKVAQLQLMRMTTVQVGCAKNVANY